MVTWFEILVIDMKRARAFYEKVFDIEVSVWQTISCAILI
jgi:hypothetical protein